MDDKPNLLVKGSDILQIIFRLSKDLGNAVKIEDISKSINPKEEISQSNLMYILNDYLTNSMKYLERCNKGNTLSNKYKITPDGFRFLNESTHMLSPSNSVFCAMWFNAKTEELYNIGIKPAIKQANLEPIKMDEEVFTEDIIAQMILRINNSKLVVADLTGQRPSVYYEAGYAQAKGLKVIFTCQKGENAHFDVNHYPIVYWESDNLQKFQNELYSRIIKITT